MSSTFSLENMRLTSNEAKQFDPKTVVALHHYMSVYGQRNCVYKWKTCSSVPQWFKSGI